jgi:hypothetical protein
MEPMPTPHPSLSSAQRKLAAWTQFRRVMRWMVAAAVAAVICSIIYLKAQGGPFPIHMLIATIAGVGFTVLLATGLMGLAFLSSGSGHDEDVSDSRGTKR